MIEVGATAEQSLHVHPTVRLVGGHEFGEAIGLELGTAWQTKNHNDSDFT